MPFLRAALYGAAMVSLYVMYAAWQSGIAPEMVVVRGVLGFIPIMFIGYLGELIVNTVPPREPEEPANVAAGAASPGGAIDAVALPAGALPTGSVAAAPPTSDGASGSLLAALGMPDTTSPAGPGADLVPVRDQAT